MRAAVLEAFGRPLVIQDLPVPEPGPDEVVIQTKACGIDGTDLKLLDGFGYRPTLPFVMGHEIAGIVEKVGSRVVEFAPGDAVVVYNFVICGECEYCLRGRDQLCAHMNGVMGVLERAGGYAEYVCAPAQQLVRLPEGVAFGDGATCCDAGLTALHAVDRADLSLGDTALVIGVGGVGTVVTQLAAQSGARVIAADISAEKAEWSREFGASDYLDAHEDDLNVAVDVLTGGAGVDRVIDVVGNEGTMSAGFRALKRGGRMIIVGYTPDSMPLPAKELAQNEKEVLGTRAGRRRDLRRCVELYATGALRSIVRHEFPLERANDALATLRDGVLGRIVLTYN